jgi:hypothetical protein
MTRSEVQYIASLLSTKTTFLEWGSGGSTRCYINFVGRYYSIEHHKAWHATVEKELGGNPKLSYQLAYVEPGTRGWRGGLSAGNYDQFSSYVHAVDNFKPGGKYDVVLVDGRARVACAAYALRHLHPESTVLIHDFYRPQNRYLSRKYGQVFRFYDQIHRVDSLVALRPKPEFLDQGANLVDIPSLYRRSTTRESRKVDGRLEVSSSRGKPALANVG